MTAVPAWMADIELGDNLATSLHNALQAHAARLHPGLTATPSWNDPFDFLLTWKDGPSRGTAVAHFSAVEAGDQEPMRPRRYLLPAPLHQFALRISRDIHPAVLLTALDAGLMPELEGPGRSRTAFSWVNSHVDEAALDPTRLALWRQQLAWTVDTSEAWEIVSEPLSYLQRHRTRIDNLAAALS